MFQPLKDLLPSALKRGRIGRQVESAQVVAAANMVLPAMVPGGRTGDACAVSFKDATVTVECQNAPAADFLEHQAEVFCSRLNERLGSHIVEHMRTRLVRRFRGTIMS